MQPLSTHNDDEALQPAEGRSAPHFLVRSVSDIRMTYLLKGQGEYFFCLKISKRWLNPDFSFLGEDHSLICPDNRFR